MRRAPADAPRALAEMPIAGSPPRLSTHPDRFLAALHPPSTSTLTSNPHSARCPVGAQLPATSCLGAFWTPVSRACLDPRYCRRPKTCTQADKPRTQVALRAISGTALKRAESVRVFCGGLLGAPDVVPGEVHMLPAERGKVSEELVRDILGQWRAAM